MMVPGTLAEVTVKPGQQVRKNDVIARLVNKDLESSVHELERAVSLYQKKIDLTRYQRMLRRDANVAGQLPELQELLASATKQLERQREDLAKLEVRAPADGTVISAGIKKAQPSPDGQLPQWAGTLLDAKNLGAFLQPNDELCRIGDPQQFEAIMAVDQADLDSIRPGQKVRVKLDAFAADIIETYIESEEDISREPMRYTSQAMSVQAGGKIATRTDAAGAPRPLSATYQVDVVLPTDQFTYKIGQRGRAKVTADPKSLGQRLWRFLTRTFHFEI